MPRKRAKSPGSTSSKWPTLATAEDDQLYPVAHTARLLAISQWLVRKHVRAGKLPVVFLNGGMYRIRAADIRAYISRRQHKVLDNAS